LELVYNADLFGAARMADLIAQLERLLEALVEAPDRPIEAASLVTPGARAALPDPAAPLQVGFDEPVDAELRRQVGRGPERTAVTDRDGAWSYRELERRSGAIARSLRDGGVT